MKLSIESNTECSGDEWTCTVQIKIGDASMYIVTVGESLERAEADTEYSFRELMARQDLINDIRSRSGQLNWRGLEHCTGECGRS